MGEIATTSGTREGAATDGADPPQGWQPLLTGDEAEESREIVWDIVRALDRLDVLEPGLAEGAAGIAVLHGYHALCEAAPERLQQARAMLDRAEHRVDGGGISLFAGVVGVAWATDHLNLRLAGEVVENTALNRRIADVAASWSGGYELTRGLVGLLVYSTQQATTESGRSALEAVLAAMERLRSDDASRGVWVTPNASLPATMRASHPEGAINLGLAHGLAGAIAAVARAHTVQPTERTRRLLDEALAWLCMHADGWGRCPGWVTPSGVDLRHERSRVAWCYGDLGLAVAIHAAGVAADVPRWREEGLRRALDAAAIRGPAAGVIDPMFCHGAIGNAHLFHRLYQASRSEPLAEAARYWRLLALEFREPDEGIAGFSYVVPSAEGPQHIASPGLLTGAAGLALALLGFVTPVAPGWDAALLTELPTR